METQWAALAALAEEPKLVAEFITGMLFQTQVLQIMAICEREGSVLYERHKFKEGLELTKQILTIILISW